MYIVALLCQYFVQIVKKNMHLKNCSPRSRSQKETQAEIVQVTS